jgi:hypothetical protein
MNNSGRNNSVNLANAAGPAGFLLGKGIIAQVVLAIVLSTALYIILMSAEMIYKSFLAVTGTRVNVMPFTVNSSDKPREFEQNPVAKNAKLLPLSDNERTGAEFSYAFYLWINPSSFRSEEGLLHILHKGNPIPFPLLGPGVFLKSEKNTLRVYMNSSKTWNNFIECDNIPVKKWVHITICARNNSIEIYINGNLGKKLNMDGAVLYQNFGNLYLFSQRPCILSPTIRSLDSDTPLQIFGTYQGNLSNLTYFSYALSYTEIQALVADGPSKKTESQTQETPPYLEDAWWTGSYSR